MPQHPFGPIAAAHQEQQRRETELSAGREQRTDAAPEQGPICDFCERVPATWIYPVGELRVPESDLPVALNLGDWSACDTCHNLIEATDYEALAAHMGYVPGGLPPTPIAMFRQARLGQAQRLGSGNTAV